MLPFLSYPFPFFIIYSSFISFSYPFPILFLFLSFFLSLSYPFSIRSLSFSHPFPILSFFLSFSFLSYPFLSTSYVFSYVFSYVVSYPFPILFLSCLYYSLIHRIPYLPKHFHMFSKISIFAPGFPYLHRWSPVKIYDFAHS